MHELGMCNQQRTCARAQNLNLVFSCCLGATLGKSWPTAVGETPTDWDLKKLCAQRKVLNAVIQRLSLLGWLRHRLFLLNLPDFDARRLGNLPGEFLLTRQHSKESHTTPEKIQNFNLQSPLISDLKSVPAMRWSLEQLPSFRASFAKKSLDISVQITTPSQVT